RGTGGAVGEGEGAATLPGPGGAGQGVGRRQALCGAGTWTPLERRFVAGDVRQSAAAFATRRSASATMRAWTDSIGGAPSTTQQRAGSAAASARKPAPTRSWKASVSRSNRSNSNGAAPEGAAPPCPGLWRRPVI